MVCIISMMSSYISRVHATSFCCFSACSWGPYTVSGRCKSFSGTSAYIYIYINACLKFHIQKITRCGIIAIIKKKNTCNLSISKVSDPFDRIKDKKFVSECLPVTSVGSLLVHLDASQKFQLWFKFLTTWSARAWSQTAIQDWFDRFLELSLVNNSC